MVAVSFGFQSRDISGFKNFFAIKNSCQNKQILPDNANFRFSFLGETCNFFGERIQIMGKK